MIRGGLIVGTKELTRRDFIGSVGMTSLLASAAIVADARDAKAASTASQDPFAYVDPELARPLRNWPGSLEAPNVRNLASLRAAGPDSPALNTPELQPRRRKVPGRSGATDVPILIIDQRPNRKNKSAVVYIHGGGYVLGSADSNLRNAQDIAQGADSLVVSVDYTLAPEAVFPTALEQNYAALAWLHQNAGQLGVDAARIAISGDSAGGGHAAALAIAARDRKEFPIAFQCLIYPMLDDRTGSTHRVPPHIGHFVWTEAANRFGWSSLLGIPAGSSSVPPGSVPARVKDLSGLPPTFIGVGSIDLFCEEDMEYAKRLALSGVRTELFVVPGAYHGFDVVARDARLSVQFREVWQSAMRRGLELRLNDESGRTA
jgi:acetyl esterase/lipase